jgi:hypothetical protein
MTLLRTGFLEGEAPEGLAVTPQLNEIWRSATFVTVGTPDFRTVGAAVEWSAAILNEVLNFRTVGAQTYPTIYLDS